MSTRCTELGITPRTLRFYEERCLLYPRRNSRNVRTYTKDDRQLIKAIQYARSLDITVSVIRELILRLEKNDVKHGANAREGTIVTVSIVDAMTTDEIVAHRELLDKRAETLVAGVKSLDLTMRRRGH